MNILSTSKSAAEFRRRMRGLVHHVQDEHQWTEEKRCDEHDVTACTDKKCMERHKWLLEKRCDKHGLIACKQCKSEKVVEVSRQCEFHPLTVCSCGECEVKKTKGKISIHEKCFAVLFTD